MYGRDHGFVFFNGIVAPPRLDAIPPEGRDRAETEVGLKKMAGAAAEKQNNNLKRKKLRQRSSADIEVSDPPKRFMFDQASLSMRSSTVYLNLKCRIGESHDRSRRTVKAVRGQGRRLKSAEWTGLSGDGSAEMSYAVSGRQNVGNKERGQCERDYAKSRKNAMHIRKEQSLFQMEQK